MSSATSKYKCFHNFISSRSGLSNLSSFIIIIAMNWHFPAALVWILIIIWVKHFFICSTVNFLLYKLPVHRHSPSDFMKLGFRYEQSPTNWMCLSDFWNAEMKQRPSSSSYCFLISKVTEMPFIYLPFTFTATQSSCDDGQIQHLSIKLQNSIPQQPPTSTSSFPSSFSFFG